MHRDLVSAILNISVGKPMGNNPAEMLDSVSFLILIKDSSVNSDAARRQPDRDCQGVRRQSQEGMDADTCHLALDISPGRAEGVAARDSRISVGSPPGQPSPWPSTKWARICPESSPYLAGPRCGSLRHTTKAKNAATARIIMKAKDDAKLGDGIKARIGYLNSTSAAYCKT
ncbi:uncharacterized protein JN550_002722 [Neoarthrinium moseri]|uniref:uncharacterized protein n=1 Tax=Neoarthrinium moseri TaxID=1658444 RepID=UPI001FDD0F4F|nr:uncharacterized protein JN550_002722 [Neoarthrinium moseri]KAI1874143.1 hypothetical protein JN550_002722 [Neoarthrinium moseri]